MNTKPKTALRHARSAKNFPKLHLDSDEYVEVAISRAKICYVLAWLMMLGGALLALIVFFIFKNFAPDLPGINFDATGFAAILAILLIVVTSGIAIVNLVVTGRNEMYITNKHVYQFSSTGLFAESSSTIDLASIEDVSYKKSGLIQSLLNFGTLRLSTVGDETTYTFKYAVVSSSILDRISDLVTSAKAKK